MSELERQLRRALDERAARVDSDLTGPELRRLAAERGRRDHRLRRAVPVLASAAAVAALGISAALLVRPQDDSGPVQPGGPGPASGAPASPATPSTPASSPTVSPSPATTPRPTSPTRPAPILPSRPTVRTATPRLSELPSGVLSRTRVDDLRTTTRPTVSSRSTLGP